MQLSRLERGIKCRGVPLYTWRRTVIFLLMILQYVQSPVLYFGLTVPGLGLLIPMLQERFRKRAYCIDKNVCYRRQQKRYRR
ncbi:uncharacterized protein YALI1_F15199g [Yarrowia lipolytica]|uniref:Uncharacterized protein n=1 Tax=Yarrowia lipolytica TaxID=4952 RepID=A0A1D8NMZ6_YARLL|nr:hypothetical protein YALI1_F15199g [Yarrowia lipolytica]